MTKSNSDVFQGSRTSGTWYRKAREASSWWNQIGTVIVEETQAEAQDSESASDFIVDFNADFGETIQLLSSLVWPFVKYTKNKAPQSFCGS